MLDHYLLINDMTSIRVYELIFMDPRKIGEMSVKVYLWSYRLETPLGVICGRHLEFIHLTRQSSY